MIEQTLFPTSTPEQQGISSEAILKFLKAIEAGNIDSQVDLHSIQIIRHGYLVAAGCAKPLDIYRQHRIYSAAKGIVAIGVMLALQENLLTLDEKLVDIFPEDVTDKVNEKMKKVTIRNLLTMNTGQNEETFGYMAKSDNWIKAFMEVAPVEEPGTFFFYNNGIPHVLAAIVARKSGEDLFDYMKPRFLGPLGVEVQCRLNAQGEREPSTVCVTEDGMTRIGYCFLHKGEWQGKQLLRKDIVELMTSFHVPTADVEWHNRDRGYGFQLWKLPADGYIFHGGNDNLIMVYNEGDMVCAIESCNKKANSGYDFQKMFHNIVYLTTRSYPLEANPEAQKELEEYLDNWNLAPKGSDESSMMTQMDQSIWKVEENAYNIEKIAFECSREKSQIVMKASDDQGEHTIICGTNGNWPECKETFIIPANLTHGNFIDGEDPSVNMFSGAWVNRNYFEMYSRSFGRIASDVYKFRFKKDELTIEIKTPALALPSMRGAKPLGSIILKAVKER